MESVGEFVFCDWSWKEIEIVKCDQVSVIGKARASARGYLACPPHSLRYFGL